MFQLIWCIVIGLCRSRSSLEAEIGTLRHQLNMLQRKAPKRLDRILWGNPASGNQSLAHA
jgi:hypothetical protein